MRLSHALSSLVLLTAAACSSTTDPVSPQTSLRGVVVLGPIGSEAQVSLRVAGNDIRLAGLTESLARLPGREVEVAGRFLSDVRFFVERINVDPNQSRTDDHIGQPPPPPPPDW
jgi:hypothetical protein